MMKFSNDTNLMKQYDGTTKQGMVKHKIEEFGLHDGWYGGNLRAVGVFENTVIKALLMEDNVTRALMVEDKDIKNLTESEKIAFGIFPEVKSVEKLEQFPIEPVDKTEDIKKEPMKTIIRPVHKTKRK